MIHVCGERGGDGDLQKRDTYQLVFKRDDVNLDHSHKLYYFPKNKGHMPKGLPQTNL